MKVLHIIPAVARRYGGPSAAIVQMVRSLRSAGVNAEVATTDADGSGRMDVPVGVTVDYDGVPVTFFRRLGPDYLKFSPGLGRWTRDRVRDFDLIHIHSVFAIPPVLAGRLARRAAVPYIVRPLGHLARWSLSQKPIRKKVFWMAGGARLIREAAALHYTSAGEMEDARAVVGPVPSFVVPLGLTLREEGLRESTASFRRTVPGLAEKPFVLFLGRIHPKKGIEALVEGLAATTTGAAGQGWALVLAGDGDPAYVRVLKELTDRHLPGRAYWVGWLEGDRKAAAMAEAGLFGLISVQENFGISAFEAMAEGTPCLLGSGVDLSAEVAAAGAGWRVAPNASAVGTALREILPAADERRRRGAAAGRFVRDRFSWPSVASRLIGEYDRIIARRGQLVSDPVEGDPQRVEPHLQGQE